MSDPTLSYYDFKNGLVWTTLKQIILICSIEFLVQIMCWLGLFMLLLVSSKFKVILYESYYNCCHKSDSLSDLILEKMSDRGESDIEGFWNSILNFKIDSKSTVDDVIQIKSRCMSDQSLSVIYLKNKLILVCYP